MLIPHLFRTEYRKIVSVLCKHFGLDQIEIAEDIASDTFLTATQAWGLQGPPQNPTAWLYNVAKNKAVNYLRREAVFKTKISPELKQDDIHEEDIDLSPQNINDSQLQMMFALCHPAISAEAQVGLSLRILCGFGIDEIAAAFLTSKDVINKRLFRAKEKLRQLKIEISLPGAAMLNERLEPVLRTIYLLFNEGYTTLRKDLSFEAMRLCTMLIENKFTNLPQVNALLSLMCFHASRFDARAGFILYDEQDSSLWNTDLVSKGGYFLNAAATGDALSKYHLEAGIAYWNTQKTAPEKWQSILQLYDQLLKIEYSPIAALNRIFTVSKVRGKEIAIAEAEQLEMEGNHFYFALLGELYIDIDNKKAKQHFEKAIVLTKTQADKEAIRRKMEKL